MEDNWKITASKKTDEIHNSIPRKWVIPGITEEMENSGIHNSKKYIDTLLPDSELEITSLPILELSSRISRDQYSSYQVCYAFCHRAALAHQILNCCTEIFFEKALEKAELLDKIFQTTGKTVGPLHGIPISLKDQVDLPGIDTTIGYVTYVGRKATRKSILAQALEDNGAIFYVKTTVPMAMMAADTISNLHGYTLNAINREFSCGGSSGGEGALIGAGGSVLGVGTDIGGSIRIPASFQGLYALKPSHGRFPYMNVSNSYVGQEIVPSVIGPLASSLEAIELFSKTIVNSRTWKHDPKVVPLPWRDTSFLKKKKLRLAVMWWDGLVMVHPPVSRALRQVVKALSDASHEVIEWNFLQHEEVLHLASKVFEADGGKEIQNVCKLSGEPFVECVKPLVGFDLNKIPLNVTQLWELGKEKSHLREKFLEYWAQTSQKTSDGQEIDALLCPVWPTTGFKKDDSEFASGNYTVPFNVLNCVSVVLPVTNADKSIDKKADHVPVNELDKKIHDYYKPDKFDQMPVCIQIVCRQLEEEKALTIASIVRDLLS